MEQTNQDLNKLTKLEYDKVPKFMRGAIGKKYGFNSLSRDIVGFLRNRMSVSVKNGWKEDGRYYVKASSKEMCDEFVTTNKTLDKALKIVENIGYISSKKGFNSSKKFFIDFEIEARLNEEYLQWKEENKSVGMHTDKLTKSDSLVDSPKLANNESECLDINSLGKIPILNEASNDNSLGNSPRQFRKNSYLERSTLERRTKNKKDYVLSYIESHDVDVSDDLKERIAERYIGSILPIDEVNERLEEMIATYKENDDEETADPHGYWKSQNEKKQNRSVTESVGKLARAESAPDLMDEHRQKSEQPKQEAAVEEDVATKVEKVYVQDAGYTDSKVMPEGAYNPFTEDLNDNENETIVDSTESYIEESDAPEYGDQFLNALDAGPKIVRSENKKPRLSAEQRKRLKELVDKANGKNVTDKDVIMKARMKCSSDEMADYVELSVEGFKMKEGLSDSVKTA